MSKQHAGSLRSQFSKAAAASFLFFALIGGPALAAHTLEPDSDDATDTTLAALSDDLELHRDTATPGAPQSDAGFPLPFAARQADEIPLTQLDDGPAAFVESSVETINDLVPNLQSEQAETSVLDASIPGVLDEDLQHFKKQMFRKDI